MADQLQIGSDLYNGLVVYANDTEIVFDPDCSGRQVSIPVNIDVSVHINRTCAAVDPPGVGGQGYCMWLLEEHSDSSGTPNRQLLPRLVAGINFFTNGAQDFGLWSTTFLYDNRGLNLSGSANLNGPYGSDEVNILFRAAGDLFDWCASIDDPGDWQAFAGCISGERCIHPITGVDGRYPP